MPSQLRELQKVDPSAQQVQQVQQARQIRDYELREAEVHATAQAGLNLNIFAAFKGSMSSRSKKTTGTNPDGSSHSVEHKQTVAVADGVGHGNMKVIGQGTIDKKARAVDSKALQKVDHLGIEDWEK